ncbi:MAG: hypothetical protein ACLRT4_18155 [Thomasclavelia sp.]
MIYDNIPMQELEKILKAFEHARDYDYEGYSKRPALYSIIRQKTSGLDINTYIYVADNYEQLKERVKRWKLQMQISNSL